MSAANLLLKERHVLIQQRLLAEGRVLALDLAQQLHVSEDTIRRDLRDLASAGLCQRVYGGALPVSPSSGPLSERQGQARDRKSQLAQAAVRLVQPGQIVFIDAGSTNMAVADALPDIKLTVVTNAPAIAIALLDRPAIDVILIGGTLDAASGACLGAKALRDIESIRSDLCFLGTCGVHAAAGLTAFGHEDAECKRTIAAMSKVTVAAVTTEKLGTAAPFFILPAGQLSHLVLESDADSAHTDAFTRQGVSVLHAQ
ncbi:DeoR/GlpR family DNA-binding transcription regulator [Janthinobacterium agaricidamnosum]|uniref:DeoR-like helix-turn-helix domain protein n=1 Tax=Janthinobacterium agaricidamnosum NBRC 102515 = DSM 9628 TaxID=1349767 RepID=W0V188_9BURK|nr:DeoR/GlpR family DNA-binding transcription regulator [Janthinobacterium agaricidamnosum]CDG81098.1 deoR-like helix-turn-helix domain protein [Janthinobacterium agaricidamnosum NBRC 102515 = DSM 9628]